MKTMTQFSLLPILLFAHGCGAKKSAKDLVSVASENLFEFGSQTTSEAVSAASAGDSEGSSGFGLMLADAGSPFKSKTKTCVEQADGTALVTITSEISSEKSSSNAIVSRSNSLSGTSTEKRTWTHPSGVKCVNGERALLNLKSDASSYGLKVNIERSRQQVISQTNLKKNVTSSSSRSYSINGSREISIVSYSEDVSNGTSIQEKKVSGSMNRSFSFVDKSGQTKTGSFSSSTIGDPMIVRVKRSLSTKEVQSREIVSGARKNTLADGTSVELSFSNFLMTGAGESCQAQSGTVAIKYLDSEGGVSQSLSCSADSGLLSCTDSAGQSVEMESPSCDPADDK